MTEIERALIAGRPPRYVQLATAAAPEGQESLDHWHSLGKAQAERLGVAQVVVDVRTRQDADNPALAATIAGAGLIYLSGGNPAYLADTLRDSAVWHAIVDAHQAGAALAGCSAGAMALSDWPPRIYERSGQQSAGLGLVANLRVIPHFDSMLTRAPDMAENAIAGLPDGMLLLGIDEETALVGGPHDWQVRGRRSVWTLAPGERQEHPAGSRIATA
jgi:cyanophycinase